MYLPTKTFYIGYGTQNNGWRALDRFILITSLIIMYSYIQTLL